MRVILATNCRTCPYFEGNDGGFICTKDNHGWISNEEIIDQGV